MDILRGTRRPSRQLGRFVDKLSLSLNYCVCLFHSLFTYTCNTVDSSADDRMNILFLPSHCVFLYVCFYMCVSICVFLYVCFCVCVSICVFLYVCFYMCVSICVFLYVCFYMCVSICVFLYVCFYMCVSICVFLYVCFYMCVSVCVCVCHRLLLIQWTTYALWPLLVWKTPSTPSTERRPRNPTGT